MSELDLYKSRLKHSEELRTGLVGAIDRLSALNAELLEALEDMVALRDWTHAYEIALVKDALAAIAKAKAREPLP
jgi:hypothetical protein